MEPTFDRLFTVDEANRLLPKLRPIVADVMAARAHLVEMQPALAPVLEKMLGNGGSRLTAELLQTFERLRADVRAVEAMGVLIKDLETGLLDFPSRREGSVVLLCWRYGESSVGHWHDVDSGFAGRQPL
ncbi:MAG TPA: DUF2203 domain-containing protein [Anaerolineales bacterium]|nr:DUF2203 domain-containing protein [Anaerolineales bacterium]